MATPTGIAVAARQAASGYALRALPRRKTYTTSWDINDLEDSTFRRTRRGAGFHTGSSATRPPQRDSQLLLTGNRATSQLTARATCRRRSADGSSLTHSLATTFATAALDGVDVNLISQSFDLQRPIPLTHGRGEGRHRLHRLFHLSAGNLTKLAPAHRARTRQTVLMNGCPKAGKGGEAGDSSRVGATSVWQIHGRVRGGRGSGNESFSYLCSVGQSHSSTAELTTSATPPPTASCAASNSSFRRTVVAARGGVPVRPKPPRLPLPSISCSTSLDLWYPSPHPLPRQA